MDTPQKVLSSLKKGQWVYSIDLKDANFQITIHPASRKFLRMEFPGMVFQFTALPFGISTAPWLFTKVVEVVKELFHRDRLSLHQYLDDWLGDAQSKQEAQTRCKLLVRICARLGFLINFKKSELIPTPVFDFVGIHFNLLRGRAYITQKNLFKLLTIAGELSWVDLAKRWQSLQVQATLVLLGRLKSSPWSGHFTRTLPTSFSINGVNLISTFLARGSTPSAQPLCHQLQKTGHWTQLP